MKRTELKLKIYIAPLEGITGHIFRKTFNEVYGGVDKYFAPFITPSEKCAVTPRDKKELSPENNKGIYLVPQILTCRSDGFISAMKELKDMGFNEVNLNLGCPSGTVCAKGKGAGFLPETTALTKFLDEIYKASETEGVKISIKTRLGYFDPDEFYDLTEIFNGFPVSELIVHPRIRSDFYKGEPRKEYFAYALKHAKCPLVYNGNIFTPDDYSGLCALFGTNLDPVMLGRGLITDLSLADKLKGKDTSDAGARFRRFHDTIYHEYQKVMSPDINVLYKMKELWSYWAAFYEVNSRDLKSIQKAKKYAEYEDVVYRKVFGL